MIQNKIAIIYDFDGTLTPKTMQEYTLLPKLGITSKSFWAGIMKETKETGAETMMVYMRHLLDSAIEKNIKISKNEFYKKTLSPLDIFSYFCFFFQFFSVMHQQY